MRRWWCGISRRRYAPARIRDVTGEVLPPPWLLRPHTGDLSVNIFYRQVILRNCTWNLYKDKWLSFQHSTHCDAIITRFARLLREVSVSPSESDLSPSDRSHSPKHRYLFKEATQYTQASWPSLTQKRAPTTLRPELPLDNGYRNLFTNTALCRGKLTDDTHSHTAPLYGLNHDTNNMLLTILTTNHFYDHCDYIFLETNFSEYILLHKYVRLSKLLVQRMCLYAIWCKV